MKNTLLFSIILLINCLIIKAKTLPPTPIYISTQIVDKGTLQQVYLQITIPRLEQAQTLEGINISYFIKSAFNSKDFIRQDTVSLAQAIKVGKTLNVVFEIEATGVRTAVLVIKASDLQLRQEAQEDFFLGAGNTFAGLVVTASNTIPDYVSPYEQVQFIGLEKQKVTVYRISQDFQAALPPMQTENANTMPDLRVDSTFTIETYQPFQLSKKGLYFAQLDTNSVHGLGFRVTETEYPKYKTVYQLIEPLIYISDYSEISPMQRIKQEDAYSKKIALDSYWLSLAKDEVKAKRMIKLYYQRIAEANQFFTTYKEGWKTDMGMVYVVFGKPESVVRYQGQEQWLYRYYGQDVRLTFVKRNNQFTRQHYELVRSEKLKDVWYEMVERWRLGLVK